MEQCGLVCVTLMCSAHVAARAEAWISVRSLKDDLGDYATHKDVWDSHTVLSLAPKINKEARQRIIFDCGTKDFFFEVNNNLHEALLKAGVEHDYIVRPGSHNWDYWNNSIDYQILFFVKSFGAN